MSDHINTYENGYLVKAQQIGHSMATAWRTETLQQKKTKQQTPAQLGKKVHSNYLSPSMNSEQTPRKLP